MSALAEYYALLEDLHRLIAAGRGDSEEAEQLIERTDEPGERLTPAE